MVIDNGSVAEKVKAIYPDGVDKVLGLTLIDSVPCSKKGGTICQVGVVGGNSGFYGGEQEDFHAMPLEKLVKQVVDGTLPIQIGKTFRIDEIVEAHRVMEQNTAGVVLA